MDINLPLILLLSTVITGFFCLIDLIFIRKDRLQAVAEVDGQFKELSEDDKSSNKTYQEAIEAVSKEPLVIEYSKSFFPVLALVFVVRSFLFEPFQIPSESMLPTLEVGDFIVVNKFSYGVRLPVARTKVVDISDPQRGDVMVFFPPNDDRYFIKRVIGLPGDTVRYTNHMLYINEELILSERIGEEFARYDEPCGALQGVNLLRKETLGERSFTARKCSNPGSLSIDGTWLVPEGNYFMMGDNRDNSRDSRDWGFVPEENIVGKAVAIWMHWEKLLSLPSFSRVGGL